jgi:spore coat protein CotH
MDMDFLNTERQPRRALESLLGLRFNHGKSHLSMGMTAFMLICAFTASAQNRPQGGPPGRGGGGRNQDRPIVKQFDQDENGRLNAEERAKAIEFIKSNPQQGRGGFRPPGGGRRGPSAPGRGGPGNGRPQPGGPPPDFEALRERFDVDKDGILNDTERDALRAEVRRRGGRGDRGFGGGPGGRRFGGPPGGRRGPGGPSGNRPAAKPGIALTQADVEHFPDIPLYDLSVLRTFFIDFDYSSWEEEMATLNNTDVDVPATVTVDGEVYKDVGIHFRGNSSFSVGNGYKRSLNLSFDFVHEKQNIQGYRTLNFLNANADPTFMHTVLSLRIARDYIAAPKANFVRVVINGENWGVYANQQQFNKDFLKDNFDTKKGTRWKVPQGGGGDGIGAFRYDGDDPAVYKRSFQIKSKDKPEAWNALIDLARTLDQTPLDQLETALESRLDVDSYLKFLALDNVLVSGDGFWTRGADYTLYLHPNGKFHFVPYDMNEFFSFRGGMRGKRRGPGGPGGPDGNGGGYQGGNGIDLEPLAGLSDKNKPIIARILEVENYRKKYLGYVREIAEKSLDWNHTGPIVQQSRDLIMADVKRDTRKLFSTDAFVSGTADTPIEMNLRAFFDERRAAVLKMLDAMQN